MKTKFCAFLLLLTLGGGAHAATLSDTAQAAVLSKKIIAAYTAEDYATTTKLFMEYDQLDAALPLPLVLVRVRAYYHLGEFFAAYQLLGDYLNLAAPDSPDYDTALDMYIALEAKPEVTEKVAKAKAKVEAETKAKTEAVIARFVEAVGHRPSPTRKDTDGITDLHRAAARDLREAAALLIEKGADVNAKSNQKYRKGYTPLHYAAERGNARETAALLIEKGADVNAKGQNGATPLHRAVREYRKYNDTREIAALLIEKGADVNAKNKDGNTPLHQTVRVYKRGHEIAALLIEKGADVNVKNNGGWTPLHEAVKESQGEGYAIAALLIEKGADVNVRENKYGETPLYWARISNRGSDRGIADLLRRHGGIE